MPLSVALPRADLARILKLASSVAARSKTIPILQSVLLRANGTGTLKVAATDLSVSLTSEAPCKVNGQGSIALPASDLVRFVSGATGDEISIVADGSVRADVKCGKAKFRIAGHADRDFPKVPDALDGGAEVDAKALHEALSRASYAVSTLEADQALCGVMFSSDGVRCEFSSTDRHQMVHVVRAFTLPKVSRTLSIGAAGAAAIAAATATGSTCRIALDEHRRIIVSCGGTTVTASLLDFACPRIPLDLFIGKHKAEAVINRDRLVEALKRVSPLSDEYRGVAINATQTGLSFVTKDADGQELADEVECEVTGELRTGARAKYLLNCVNHLSSDAITIRVIDENSPIVFVDHDDAEYTAVVMPMRID